MKNFWIVHRARADILIECAQGDQNIIQFYIIWTMQFQNKSNPNARPVFAEFKTQFAAKKYPVTQKMQLVFLICLLLSL